MGSKVVKFVKCPFCDRVIPDLPFIKYNELASHAHLDTAKHAFVISNMKHFRVATKKEMRVSDKLWKLEHKNE